jgi:C4-dicarboxylate-specific signal transduction histidine kinase
VTKEPIDVNEVIREMDILLRNEATQQQVLMNLMINGIEAMKTVDGPRQLTLHSQQSNSEQVLVSVEDTGVGLPSRPSRPDIQRILHDQGAWNRYGAAH